MQLYIAIPAITLIHNYKLQLPADIWRADFDKKPLDYPQFERQ